MFVKSSPIMDLFKVRQKGSHIVMQRKQTTEPSLFLYLIILKLELEPCNLLFGSLKFQENILNVIKIPLFEYSPHSGQIIIDTLLLLQPKLPYTIPFLSIML